MYIQAVLSWALYLRQQITLTHWSQRVSWDHFSLASHVCSVTTTHNAVWCRHTLTAMRYLHIQEVTTTFHVVKVCEMEVKQISGFFLNVILNFLYRYFQQTPAVWQYRSILWIQFSYVWYCSVTTAAEQTQAFIFISWLQYKCLSDLEQQWVWFCLNCMACKSLSTH